MEITIYKQNNLKLQKNGVILLLGANKINIANNMT